MELGKYRFVDEFKEGFARVQRSDGKWNFIDEKGKILSSEWFDDAWSFNENFAGVQLSDKSWNFIDKEGKILSRDKFTGIRSFKEGFAEVERSDGKWNFINKQGKIVEVICPLQQGLRLGSMSTKLISFSG